MMLFAEMRDVDFFEVQALCDRIAAMPVPEAEPEWLPRVGRRKRQVRPSSDGLAYATFDVAEWLRLVSPLVSNLTPQTMLLKRNIVDECHRKEGQVTIWNPVGSWCQLSNDLLRSRLPVPASLASRLTAQITRTRRD